MSKLKSLEELFAGHHFDLDVIIRFRSAAITLSGIELIHRIRKGQFSLARLRLKDTAAPAAWVTPLSA
ncbi:hypothetical protein [Burkholderia sp. L27(2015)]|uniref:hypothetical protein n=1 Tax=Burkholderia sp. L27(2015) TaxID=1641858 RepID=UPI0020B1597F|nr:hypothetical protein [Burkholderia sp. L27(2015)]